MQDDFFARDWDASRTTILVVNAEPIGYCVIEHRPADIHVRELVLQPASQGQGFGAQLLKQVQAQASIRGVPVRLGTFVTNRARALYERLGFRVFDQTATHVLMEWQPRSSGLSD
jgi:GNAT superfamily N-acetyltransferase